jgi:hypothetical protein
LRIFSLFAAVCALFNSSVAINRSSSSRVSSIDLASSNLTVASNVARRRPSPWRRICATSALIPYRASSFSRRGGTRSSAARSAMPRPITSAT